VAGPAGANGATGPAGSTEPRERRGRWILGSGGSGGQQRHKRRRVPRRVQFIARSRHGVNGIHYASGLAYSIGARARASSAADGTNYMEGLVTGYSGTTLTVN